MPIRRFLIRVVFAGCLTGLALAVQDARSQSKVGNTRAQSHRVDSLFARWDGPDSPGCALGVIRDGEFIYRRGYGMANLEHNVPISPSSVFPIASTSKQFVAAAIILAAEEGHLALDDDIREHVPEMPDYGKTITIRHLLNHTSGIRDFLTLWAIAGEEFSDVHEPEEALGLIARQEHLNFEPGAEHLYSNSGYFLLAQIIERATGETLREYARERIFEPLGMEHTHFHDDHTGISKGRALGHVRRDDGSIAQYISNFDLVGSGGLHTSVDDLLAWDRNFYEDRLSRGMLLPELHRRGILTGGDTIEYASGLSIGVYKGLHSVSHGGAAQDYRTELLRFPEQRLSVICLCNLGEIDPVDLARRVADIYLADAFPAAPSTTGAEGREEPREAPQPIELDAERLERWSGAYRNPETGTIWRVSRAEGRLRVEIGDFAFHLVPISESEFVGHEDAPFLRDVRFEPTDARAARIHARFWSGDAATFQPIDLVEPSAAALAEFAGRYWSDELEAEWELGLTDGTLGFVDDVEAVLRPLVRDEFTIAGATVRFLRDGGGAITGLTIDAGRVRDLEMRRVAEDCRCR